MNFNTQVCTTREQSERLLALGLKKETADCFIWTCDGKDYTALNSPDAAIDESKGDIVAWSLHRLWEMCPQYVDKYRLWNLMSKYSVFYCDENWDSDEGSFSTRSNLYDNLIDCIEWLIKENYFDKEYLEETK